MREIISTPKKTQYNVNEENNKRNVALLSPLLEGEETLQCRCLCRPPEEKFKTVGSKHGRMRKLDFSALSRKYLFWANLVRKK